jgi:hypothetical protein
MTPRSSRAGATSWPIVFLVFSDGVRNFARARGCFQHTDAGSFLNNKFAIGARKKWVFIAKML